MGTKHVWLDEEFYEWVKSQSRGSETISETLERLTRRSELLDIPEILDEEGREDAKQTAQRGRERKDRKAAAREAFRERSSIRRTSSSWAPKTRSGAGSRSRSRESRSVSRRPSWRRCGTGSSERWSATARAVKTLLMGQTVAPVDEVVARKAAELLASDDDEWGATPEPT